MRHRCRNPKFKYWAGRGIKVCPEWDDFIVFLHDMGERPDGLTLERKDNDAGYSKGNCIWATRHVQHRNTRQTVRVEIGGVTKCLKDWAKDLGIGYTTVQGRIYRHGWSPIQALTTPVDPNWRIRNLGAAR